MKSFLALIISCLSLIVLKANAETITISCPHTPNQITAQLIGHWAKTPFPWYASWAHQTINGHILVAGIRTYQDQYPDNPDPSLQFLNARYSQGRDSGEFEVSCVYQIQNSEMMDIESKLFVRTFVQANRCRAESIDTITCE